MTCHLAWPRARVAARAVAGAPVTVTTGPWCGSASCPRAPPDVAGVAGAPLPLPGVRADSTARISWP